MSVGKNDAIGSIRGASQSTSHRGSSQVPAWSSASWARESRHVATEYGSWAPRKRPPSASMSSMTISPRLVGRRRRRSSRPAGP